MAASNNLAYDISVYEPLEKKQPKPEIKVRSKTHQVKTISAARSLLTAVAALCILCAMLYGKVETSKLYNEASALNKQLNTLNSENDRLQAEIESKTTRNKVEDIASSELGLVKLDKSQVQYIEVQKDNVTKVVENDDKNIFVSIKDWFSGVMEYIGI